MVRQQRLDEIDLKILAELQREGRIPNLALAERVGLSSAPCFRRVKALERAKVIRRYAALLDPAALGLNVTVLVRVSLDRQMPDRVHAFEAAMLERPEVMECWLITGAADFLVRVVVKDVEAYQAFHREVLSVIPGVASIDSSFALKQVKNETELPIDGAQPRRGYGHRPRISSVGAINSAAARDQVRRAG